MRHVISTILVGLLVSVSACGEGHGGDATAPPTAPTGLMVAALSGGAHLTWTDTSDNEDHFMVMRKPTGGTYAEVDTLAFDTVTYHDSSVTAGMTYVYKVVAMNAKGEASSNEVMFAP